MRFLFLLIIIFSFFTTACTYETSTSQEIAIDEITQDPNVDIFLINHSVYKKVGTIKDEDIDIDNFSSLGKITNVYSGKGNFQENMSTKLPVDTEIYIDEQTVTIIAKTDSGFIQYKSIPEG